MRGQLPEAVYLPGIFPLECRGVGNCAVAPLTIDQGIGSICGRLAGLSGQGAGDCPGGGDGGVAAAVKRGRSGVTACQSSDQSRLIGQGLGRGLAGKMLGQRVEGSGGLRVSEKMPHPLGTGEPEGQAQATLLRGIEREAQRKFG